MDPSAIRCVQGAVAATTNLLAQKWDHIFYTGNGAVGRIVMAAAAKNLTPVTLELGGKSPVYVDKSAKIDTAVARISAAKWMNTGQTCVAPDYIMVHEEVAAEFSAKMKLKVTADFGDAASNDRGKLFGRVINSRHTERVAGLVKGTKGKVLVGGLDSMDGNRNFMPPTIVLQPGVDEPMMHEEIFGPVLPILKVSSEDDAIALINQVCDRPLALYVYAQDSGVIEKVLNSTSSGGVAVNSSLEQLIDPELPFGGVGESGMGAYHGKWGFDEFCHKRSVLYKDTMIVKGMLEGIPINAPDWMYDIAVKYQVIGFFTNFQKRVVMASVGALTGALGYSFLRSKL